MNWFRENFMVKKRERIGLYLLIGLIFLLSVVRFFLLDEFITTPTTKYDNVLDTVTFVNLEEEFAKKKEYQSYKKDTVYPRRYQKKTSKKSYPKKGKKIVRQKFRFNPNTLSEDSLKLLGFKPYVAKNIIKYRSKGGKFYNIESLNRMYGIDQNLVAELSSYINIPKPKSKKKFKKQYSEFKKKVAQPKKDTIYPNFEKKKPFDKIVNINGATLEELDEVPGIGPFYAKNIIKMREELGGFHSTDQLLELYNLTKQNYDRMKPFLKVDGIYKKVNVNTDDYKELANHKYISWKMAKIIVNYRKSHGSYKNVDDLKQIKLIDTHWIDRVGPYLSY